MTSNFDFLKTDFPDIYESATRAENLIYADSRASCFYARYTLEQAVHWLYVNDPYLNLPYDNNLAALIHEQTFKDNLSPHLFPKIRIIVKIGNTAVHDTVKISEKDSLHLTSELFHFLYWLCRYYSPNGKNLPKLQFIPPYQGGLGGIKPYQGRLGGIKPYQGELGGIHNPYKVKLKRINP